MPILSSGKNEITANDKAAPSIIITSPASGQIFMAGQPISITGMITDNNSIAEVHIHVTNITTIASDGAFVV